MASSNLEPVPNAPPAETVTPAVLYLCRRFRLDPALADLVAALAGFPDRRSA
jgi:hypothetical protein